MMWGRGVGFYDQGSGYGPPANKAMQGGGLQQQLQQPRSLLGSAEYQGGINRQSQVQTDYYSQGSYTEQPPEEDYYGRRFGQGGYVEEQGGYTEQQTDNWAGLDYGSQASYEPVAYDEQQYFDYAHGNKPNQPKVHQQQRGTLAAAAAADKRGLMNQPRSLPEGGGWRDQGDWYESQDAQAFPSQTQEPGVGADYPRQQRSGLKLPNVELGGVTRPRGQTVQRNSNVANASKLEQPQIARSLMGDSWQQPDQEEINTHRGLSLGKEGRGHMDAAGQSAKGLIHTQREPKENINQGMLEPSRGGRGLMGSPRDQRGQTRAMIDQGRLDRISNQRGFMEEPMVQMDVPREQRGLMDTPRPLLDLYQESARDKQGMMSPPGTTRGRLTAPKEQGLRTGPVTKKQETTGAKWEGRPENRRGAGPGAKQGSGQETRRGAGPGSRQVSQPGTRQGASPGTSRQEARRGAGGHQKQRGNKARRNKRANRNKDHASKDLQLELMEKAGLQMKLLEEQQQQAQWEEMERMTLLQQQALLMQQQQQQHLQQFQQQQQLHIIQEQQLYQQQQEAKLLLSGGRERNIPSIFEVPTKGSLGKRSGGSAGPSDNKRPRNRLEDRKRGSQADKRNDSRKLRYQSERQRQLQRDKKREKRRKKRLEQARQSSSSKNKRDGRDSGSAKNSTPKMSDRDRGGVKDNKGKDKVQATTEVTIDLKEDDKYDPSKPTSDDNKTTKGENKKDEHKSTNKSEKTEENKVEKTAEENTGKTDKTESVKSETNKDELKRESKDGRKTECRDKDDRSRSSANKKETADKPEGSKKYHCEVCSANCFNMENFDRHMNGRKHKLKVELVKGRVQAEEHLRQIESKRKSPAPDSKGRIGTHCKTCDKMYMGEYKSHSVTPAHKAREDRIKKGCKICNVTSFNAFIDLTKHLQSELHKKNKRKLQIEEVEDDLGNLVILDVVGFEEDSTKKKSDPTSSARKTSGLSPTSLKPEDEVFPEKYDPQIPVGLRYIVPVSGFFCKLCSKFCINETSAKVEHCQSQPHYEKLKDTLAAKLLDKSTEAADKKDVDRKSEETTSKSITCNEGSDAASHVKTEESLISHNGTLTGVVEPELGENKSTIKLDTNQSTVQFEDSQSTVLMDENQTKVELKVNQSTVELNASQSTVELDVNQSTDQSNMEASNCEMTGEHQDSTVVGEDQAMKEEKCEITISINDGAEENSVDLEPAEEQNSQVLVGDENKLKEGENENSQVKKGNENNQVMQGGDENRQVIEGDKNSQVKEGGDENSQVKMGNENNQDMEGGDENRQVMEGDENSQVKEGGVENSQVKEGGDENSQEVEQEQESSNMEIDEGEENGLNEEGITEEGVEDMSKEEQEEDNEKCQEGDGLVMGNDVRGNVQKARRGRAARGRRGKKH